MYYVRQCSAEDIFHVRTELVRRFTFRRRDASTRDKRRCETRNEAESNRETFPILQQVNRSQRLLTILLHYYP